MILLGVAAIVGCFVLTSFDKKTLAQQKEEIAAAVTAQLDSLKMEKAAACTEAVMVEATIRYNAWVEAENAKPAVGGKKRVVKKAVPSGPKVDPLPQSTNPPKDPQKTRSGAVEKDNPEAQKTRSGAVEKSDPVQQKKRGGAVKEGGN